MTVAELVARLQQLVAEGHGNLPVMYPSDMRAMPINGANYQEEWGYATGDPDPERVELE